MSVVRTLYEQRNERNAREDVQRALEQKTDAENRVRLREPSAVDQGGPFTDVMAGDKVPVRLHLVLTKRKIILLGTSLF